MVSHKEVAREFAKGRTARGSRMYSKWVGENPSSRLVIYSFGPHFPLALKINGYPPQYLVNKDGYSSSTSKHKHYVRSHLSEDEVIECDTQTIQRAINNPDEPIVVNNVQWSDDIPEILSMLRSACKSQGLKRFPMKKFSDQVRDLMIMEKI